LAKRKAAAKASVAKTGMSEVLGHRLREGAFIGFAVVCIYVFIALSSYNANDPGWSTTGSGHSIRNAGGITGAYISDIFYTLFGYMAFLFPILLGYRAWLIFRERQNSENFDWFHFAVRVGGFCLVMISATGLSQINVGDSTMLPEGAGGILGVVIGDSSLNAFSITGARLLLLALFLFGVTIFTGLSWLKLMDDTGRMTITLWQWLKLQVSTLHGKWRDMRVRRQAQKKRQDSFEQQIKKVEKRKQPKIEPVKKPVEQGKRVFKEKQVNLFKPSGNGELPQLSLLDTPSASDKKGYSEEALRSLSQRLEHKLDDFGITAEVKAVFPGPVITRFEIDPAPGIKVSRISNLAKDLARSLSVISVRVVEVIPGKSFVGIEIPNEDREMVYLSQVLSSKTFDDARSPVSLALGHDIAGLPIIADLSKMPHLLVAGTTGSGKSVGVNAMLLSLLYKASPDEVRLIMVDPKMLELSIYDGIPHLLTPVITDMKDAASGLRWCVGEMERRYKQMAALGVRNLQGYNRKVNDAIASGNPIPDPLWQFDPNAASIGVPEVTEAPTLGPLPFIVVVIDEFADMMMIVGKKVEELIARIAQKARAAGIHLILATQRPSVDVITGLITANIPTRIAFQVSSKIDSRTILDQGGAEQLLGHGDMLYLPPGTGLPVRVHGAFVDDHEVHKVVEDWKQRAQPNYIEDLLEDGANEFVPGYSNPAGGGGDEDPEADALYDEAVHFVTQSRKASISSVQRKLRIGYNRAARMIETMEETGVVSPMGTNGQREVLAPSPPGD
jgi:S-DNA-T family DNA segregation ATPase FtsK/SpoIIIE